MKKLSNCVLFLFAVSLSSCDLFSDLFSNTGNIQINCKIKLSIYLDDTSTDKSTPSTISNIQPGYHTITLYQDKKLMWGPRTVQVKKNETAIVDATITFLMGLRTLPEAQYNSIPSKAPPSSGLLLPDQWDISDKFPTPRDQNPNNNCVGWAVGYALKTYLEKLEYNWDLSMNSHLFSPTFIYNQINLPDDYGGEDGGAYISDALNLLQNKGCATYATMPNDADITANPSVAAFSEAENYKIFAYWKILISTNVFKAFLATNTPIIIGYHIYDDFWLNDDNKIYDNLDGELRGNHANVLVGYDDNKKAFKVMNSWGEDWGENGFGWVSYNIIGDAVYEAYVVTDARQEFAHGTIEFSSTQKTVSENTSTTQIGISRINGSQGALTVNLAYENGTATYGNDFSFSASKITWDDGEDGTKYVNVNIIDDLIFESEEYFKLKIVSVDGGGEIGGNNSIMLNINDNDNRSISMDLSKTSIDFDTVNIGDSDSESIIIKNLNTSNSDLVINISCVLSDGFSLSDSQGQYTIKPGNQKLFLITFEPNEIGEQSGRITINNNSTNLDNTLVVNIAGEGTSSSASSIPSEDSYVDSYYPNSTNDSSGGLIFGRDTGYYNGYTRAYLKFDYFFEDAIDSGSTVLHAYLTLTFPFDPSASFRFKIGNVSGSWSEASLTWNNKPSYTINTTKSYLVGSRGQKVTYDVTEEVAYMVRHNQRSLVIVKQDETTNGTTVISASETYSGKPILKIEYIP